MCVCVCILSSERELEILIFLRQSYTKEVKDKNNNQGVKTVFLLYIYTLYSTILNLFSNTLVTKECNWQDRTSTRHSTMPTLHKFHTHLAYKAITLHKGEVNALSLSEKSKDPVTLACRKLNN